MSSSTITRRKPRPAKKKRAERDHLLRLIQAAITTLEAVDRMETPVGDGDLEFDGYCARAAAAYQYLVKHDEGARELAADPVVKLMRAKPSGYADSHYWLENSAGEVLEVNAGRWDKNSRYPYEEGKGTTVRRDKLDPSKPASKDSQRIIAIVQTTLDALPDLP